MAERTFSGRFGMDEAAVFGPRMVAGRGRSRIQKGGVEVVMRGSLSASRCVYSRRLGLGRAPPRWQRSGNKVVGDVRPAQLQLARFSRLVPAKV